MRVFPDTNVLLSAFFAKGLCEDLVSRLIKSEHAVLIGEPVAREFVRIAKRKFRVNPPDLSFALEVMRRQIAVPAATGAFPTVSDPDDAPILATAAAAGAELFITGDKAVLAVKRVARMRIVSPREAWTILFTPTTRK